MTIMEIQDLFKDLWRRKWVIILTPVVGAIITIFFLQFRSDKYASNARISTGFTKTDKIELNDSELMPRAFDTEFNNLLELMRSPLSYNLLSYRLLLHDLEGESRFRAPRDPSIYMEENKLSQIGKVVGNKVSSAFSDDDVSIYSLYTAEEIARVQKLINRKLTNQEPLDPTEEDFELMRGFFIAYGYDYEALKDALNVYRVQGTDYIQVGFESGNNLLSAYAANAYCEEFIRYYQSIKGDYSSESVTFLQEVAKEKKTILDEKLEMMGRFESSDVLLKGDQGDATRYGQLVGLENKRDALSSQVNGLELTVDRLRRDLSESGAPNQQNQQIIQLQSQIKDLNAKYVESGSTNRDLSDSLAYLRGKLRSAIASIETSATGSSTDEIQEKLKDAQIDLQVSRNELNMVNRKLSQLESGLSSKNTEDSEIASVQNEIEIAKQDYNEVLAKLNAARNQQVSNSNLKQVIKATPAIMPSSIGDIYILGISVLTCLALAVFVVILNVITDNTIRTPSRFKRMVHLPLIGTLNHVQLKGLDVPNMFLSTHKKKQEAEMYKSSLRQIRYQLESTNSKVFLFTSLKPKSGKTTIISYLAYALSLLKKRVLIIDTNFKDNSLTKMYGQGLSEIKVVKRKMVNPKPQLAKVVQNGGVQEDQLSQIESSLDLVNATRYEDIFFVGNSGITGESPSELLSRRDFKRFILKMAEQFDYIFLEGSAINDYSDSRELAGYVQKVITVVHASSTVKPIDEHSVSYLKSLGEKSAGAILNGVRMEDMQD
ncbi:MAG: Wzz/FepE/Etk N-terminal domain-containing protein [Marinoscillum sp.]